ncbi:hypothetical protein C7974DRAFT_452167 [Boeremia exigua]|uniref:uncharacterized protein n=1 Tax=Boeremia exigua TaxID=749465 RepID=UPI001E8E3013|nr:uncharacterized protein C7974DRAFT_452167 [Boeremia exigua]KAH6633023.1 hypothetical protein C7974DRAFT_452167 [Boeremia exigua]
MVLGILIAVVTAPGLLGSQEAIRQGQSKDKREEHRARRCNLIATCVKSSARSREIDGRPVVLRDGKLWIDTTTDDGEPFGHTYAGYYLPYPDSSHEGLVTTITDVAPIMNWVYIDRETHEARYGVRADAQPNLTGPFNCTRQDRRLTFEGWEGWCAVEEFEGHWSLYFDVDDNGLKSKVASGTRVLEIELSRKEKRFQKQEEVRQQDQKIARAVDAQKDAPVDRPLQQDDGFKRPGVFGEPLPGPISVYAEDLVPETPLPARSNPRKSTIPPISQISSKRAADILDDSLAIEKPAVLNTQPENNSTSPPRVSPQTMLLREIQFTPKINRSSGSKAMTQAQLFDAMAAAQMREATVIARTNSGAKRSSLASGNVQSASAHSGEQESPNQDISSQSGLSQRPSYRSKTTHPLPIASAPQSRSIQTPDITVQLPKLSPYSERTDTIDPGIFEALSMGRSEQRSRISPSYQRKRNSKTFTARRPGKRLSPITLTRKSLIDTMSSDAGRLTSSLSRADRSSKMRFGREKIVNRIQKGRKTTSTLLRDLDDLVRQEQIFITSMSNQKSSTSKKGLVV